MDRIFEIIECTDLDEKRLATFRLTYAAVDWWDAVRATIGEEGIRRMTWTAFKNRFYEKYFPVTEKYKREREFMHLTQGKKLV